MSNLFLILSFIIPILFISLLIMSYYYMNQFKYRKVIISTLSSNHSKILDKNKMEAVNKKDTWLSKKLKFAGFSHKSSSYVFIFISITFGLLVSFFVFFVTQSSVIFVSTFLIFSLFPYLFLLKLIKTRQEEFNFSLKEIIDKVTSMMRSGVGFEQALKKSIITCKSKLTQEVFNIYVNEKSIIGEDKCFEKMFDIIESKELRIFYLTISIGRKSGGKFSNTLDKLRKTLHDQGEIKQEITSSTKEVKIGTYMIIALIFFTYFMMNSALDNALNAHFFGSDIGKLQMFFIIVWVAFGIFVNSLLTKIK